MYFAFGPRGILDWEVFGKSLHVFGILDWGVYYSEESSEALRESSSDGGEIRDRQPQCHDISILLQDFIFRIG